MYNRHNVRTWSQINPKKFQTIRFQGRTSVIVWCEILSNKIIGPIFYNGALTGNRYLQFLQENIEDLLEDLPLAIYRKIIWQHNGAPPPAVRDVVGFLNNRYNQWIGRNETIGWPPNSPDLSILDGLSYGVI